MPRYRRAVLGGTFDHLHVGHHALLAAAFAQGREVAIGLTTARFLSEHPKPGGERIQSYSRRRAALVRWLRGHAPRHRWRVVPLSNVFGRSVDPGVDVLIVSAESVRGGRAVNRERRRLGRPPIPVVVVPLVLGDDLEPVSSRRIRSGEIAPDGCRLSAIHVVLVTRDPVDRESALREVRRVFPRARVTFSRSLGSPALRRPGADLEVLVARRRRGGWTVSERSPRIRLAPRRVTGRTSRELERGIREVLRPTVERKVFERSRPRTRDGNVSARHVR